MGIVVRQSIKSSMAAYIGVAIGVINQLYISTKFLGVDELALSRLLLENSIIFATFAHLGTPFIADKFFARYRDDAQKHHGFFVWLLVLPILGCAIFVLFYFIFEAQIQKYFAENSPLVTRYHFLVIPITIFWAYMSVLESYCRNNSRVAIPAFIREIYLRVVNIVIVLIYGFGWVSFDVFMYLIVLLYASAVLVLLFYIKWLGKFYWTYEFFKIIDWALFKEMMFFGLFILMGGAGANIVLFIDRTMLAGKSGLTDAGIFIIAATIASIIEIPRKSITQISIPIISHSLKENDMAHIKRMYQKSALHQLVAGTLVFLLIFCNLDDLFLLIPKGDIYAQGKWVVILLSASKLFDMATGLSSEIIMYSRFFKFTTYFLIGIAILGILANKWLIPLYQFNGAALATAFTTLVYSLLRMGFVKYHFNILPYTQQVWKVVGIFIIVYVAIYFIPSFGVSKWAAFFSIGVKSVIIVCLSAIFIIKWHISEEIDGIFQTIKTNISSKLS